MNSENGFDDLIRKKLESGNEEVNPLSWSTVEKELPPVVQRSAFLRKRYLVLLLLVSFGTYFYTTHSVPHVVPVNKMDAVNGRTQPTPIGARVQTPDKALTNKVSGRSVGKSIKDALLPAIGSDTRKAPEGFHSPIATNSELPPVNSQPETRNIGNPFKEHWQPMNEIAFHLNSPEIVPAIYLSALLKDEETEQGIAIPPDSVFGFGSLIATSAKRELFFVEGFYSPDFSAKKMTSNTADEGYLRLRKNTERYFYSHSMGFRAGYQLNAKLFVKTGYDYTEVQERLSYSYIPGIEEATKLGLTVDTISGTLIDPLTSTSKDTIIGNYQVIGEVTVQNYYRYHNIPIIINYSLGKGKLKWRSGGGLFMNVGLKTKGRIINTDRLTRINLADNKELTPYKSTLGMGISAELVMSYELAKNVSFLLGPHGKYYFSTISKNNAPLREKFFNWGIYTGLKFSF